MLTKCVYIETRKKNLCKVNSIGRNICIIYAWSGFKPQIYHFLTCTRDAQVKI